MELGRVGVWDGALRYGDKSEVADAAAELESLGYSALWFPDMATDDDIFAAAARLLDATRSVVVATGILNLWIHEPPETAAGLNPDSWRTSALRSAGSTPFARAAWTIASS